MREKVLSEIWLTQQKYVCHRFLCLCRLVLVVNVGQIVTATCIELSFHFYCFVPHTVLRSLRSKWRRVVSLVTANQKRRKDKKKCDVV